MAPCYTKSEIDTGWHSSFSETLTSVLKSLTRGTLLWSPTVQGFDCNVSGITYKVMEQLDSAECAESDAICVSFAERNSILLFRCSRLERLSTVLKPEMQAEEKLDVYRLRWQAKELEQMAKRAPGPAAAEELIEAAHASLRKADELEDKW
jgi:hypothetical protein